MSYFASKVDNRICSSILPVEFSLLIQMYVPDTFLSKKIVCLKKFRIFMGIKPNTPNSYNELIWTHFFGSFFSFTLEIRLQNHFLLCFLTGGEGKGESLTRGLIK